MKEFIFVLILVSIIFVVYDIRKNDTKAENKKGKR